MSGAELVAFDDTFAESEMRGIAEAIEHAEVHFKRAKSNSERVGAPSLVPPWFVLKDNIPGQSVVYITHRSGASGAVVSHSIDEFIEHLITYTGEPGPT